MSLSFGIEKLAACWNEVMIAAAAHWSETENFRRGEVFNPSFERYKACEDIGFFHLFVARDGAKLAGYAGMYVTQSMHSQTMIAVEDTWFLLPEYRKGRNAIEFVRYVERRLREMGVEAVQMSAKIANNAGRILEYLDYRPVSTVYWKSLRIPASSGAAESSARADSATSGNVKGELSDVRTEPAPAA